MIECEKVGYTNNCNYTCDPDADFKKPKYVNKMKALFGHWELYGVIPAGMFSFVTIRYHKLFATEKPVVPFSVTMLSRIVNFCACCKLITVLHEYLV